MKLLILAILIVAILFGVYAATEAVHSIRASMAIAAAKGCV